MRTSIPLVLLLVATACGGDEAPAQWLGGFSGTRSQRPAWLTDLPGAPVAGLPIRVHRAETLAQVRTTLTAADELRIPDDYLRHFKVVVIACEDVATCLLAPRPGAPQVARFAVSTGVTVAPQVAGVESGPVLVRALWATVERVEFVTPAGEPLAVVPI